MIGALHSNALIHSTGPWWVAIPAVVFLGLRIWLWRRRGGRGPFGGSGS